MPHLPIFMHLTKTAGGTLKEGIRQAAGMRPLFVYSPDALAEFDREEHNIVYGHMAFGVHATLDIPPEYYCFLRHPWSRTISHFHHLANNDRSRVGDKMRRYDDINDFFRHGRHWEFENFMCRMLSGVADGDCEVDRLYELAADNAVRHFRFIGFHEFFDLSVLKLSHCLGRRIRIRRNVNVGSYDRFSVNRRTADRIVAENQADMRLYRFCLTQFLERFDSGRDFLLADSRPF